MHEPSEDVRYGYTSQDQAWRDAVSDITRSAEDWRRDPEGMNRYDFAKSVKEQAQAELEQVQLMNTIETSCAEEGYSKALDYLRDNGYGITSKLAPSPLFPEGRRDFLQIDEHLAKQEDNRALHLTRAESFTTADGKGGLKDEIIDYLVSGYPKKRSAEIAETAIQESEPITSEELATLREQYGAKATSLLAFNKRVTVLNNRQEVGFGYGIKIDIPTFRAVSVDMFKAWQNDPELFKQMTEVARQDALGLAAGDTDGGGLVAIRSSAVYSEDGEQSTGAGVYLSLAVNPKDVAAFTDVITQVYESTNSESAKSYRSQLGVDEEQMGLLMQRYVETADDGHRRRGHADLFYGHANSQGANPNLIDVNTDAGTLLFDKNAVVEFLLISGGFKEIISHLHSYPDHDSALYSASMSVGEVPHAAILAERLFGRPMQVEFVNDKIVQVRPIVNLESGEAIVSPDEEHLVEVSGVGFGDVELDYLDVDSDNRGKQGYVVFEQEYEFSMRGMKASLRGQKDLGYDMFPEQGAVVILEPSSSGHIQTLCRERGILCIYPSKSDEDAYRNLRDVLRHREDRYYEPNKKTFRFVSDGYVARLYEPSEVAQQEDSRGADIRKAMSDTEE